MSVVRCSGVQVKPSGLERRRVSIRPSNTNLFHPPAPAAFQRISNLDRPFRGRGRTARAACIYAHAPAIAAATFAKLDRTTWNACAVADRLPAGRFCSSVDMTPLAQSFKARTGSRRRSPLPATPCAQLSTLHSGEQDGEARAILSQRELMGDAGPRIEVVHYSSTRLNSTAVQTVACLGKMRPRRKS